MELNRHHYFMLGLILLFAGLECRMIDSVYLNEPTSRFLSENLSLPPNDTTNQSAVYVAAPTVPTPHRIIRPPRWMGWSFISIAVVLVLHSFAMPRPQ